MKHLAPLFAILVLLVASGLTASAQNTRDVYAAQGCNPVTPNDTTTFTPSRLVLVGGSGALHVTFNNGAERTLPATIVTDSWAAPLSIVRVYSTDTTATDIWVCN